MLFPVPQRLRPLFITLALCIPFALGFSQNTNVPEGGFENWVPGTNNLYEVPGGNWWASLNQLRDLGAPVTVSKSTDAHSGSYSAKLETRTFGTLIVPGILVPGEFDMNHTPGMIREGRPFTSTPARFHAWFRYLPVNGDSAYVAARLVRRNPGTNQQEIVAEAGITLYDSAATWTEVDSAFVWRIPGALPDSIIVVLLSSAGAANMQGQAGSALWVDDVTLEYTTSAEQDLTPFLFSSCGPACWKISATSQPPDEVIVRDISGRTLMHNPDPGPSCVVDLSATPSGIYFISTRSGESLRTRRVIRP